MESSSMDKEAHEFQSNTEGSDHSSHQVSLGTGDSNSNSNTKQESPVGEERLSIKVKIGANNNQLPQVCRVCKKEFSSGKALGGHMRLHVCRTHSKKVQPKSNGHKHNTYELVGSTTCVLCGKKFPSMKSLFGHMRAHPGREWRGIQPPSSTSPSPPSRSANAHLSSSTSLSTLSDYGHIESAATASTEDSVVDLSRSLPGWSVTAKRGRKSTASNTDSGLAPHIEKRIEEAVFELMMLAHGNRRQDVEVEFSVPPTKKLKIEGEIPPTNLDGGRKNHGFATEKPVTNMGCEDEGSESDSQNTEGRTADEYLIFDPEMKKKENKKKKRIRKVKLTDIETVQESNYKLISGTGTPNRYTCSICNKSFPSHQALGGHRSSHNKFRNIQIRDVSESTDASAAEEENQAMLTMKVDETETETAAEDALGSSLQVSGHQCNICSKTFPTGQALGGHKRSHWTGITEAPSAQATSPGENSETCAKILNFDLNELPAKDEEGFQSDQSIPLNAIAAAAGYASSSLNSVTD